MLAFTKVIVGFYSNSISGISVSKTSGLYSWWPFLDGFLDFDCARELCISLTTLTHLYTWVVANLLA